MKLTRLLRNGLSIGLLVLMLFESGGCGPQWRKKFTRKHKTEAQLEQPILVLQPDALATYPPDVRYREHFAYWKTWHSELLASLGQIKKRDLRYLNGSVGELRAMVELLSGPQAQRLREILVELSDMEESWSKAPEVQGPSAASRSRLEQIEREINKKFHYSKVKAVIIQEPAREKAQDQAKNAASR